MPTIRQKRGAKLYAESLISSAIDPKLTNNQAVLQEAGYTPKSARQSTKIIASTGFKQELAANLVVIEPNQLTEISTKLKEALNNRDFEEEPTAVVAGTLKIIEDIQARRNEAPEQTPEIIIVDYKDYDN